MDPDSRLCTGVIYDLVEMQKNLLLGSPLIELTFETPLGRVSTLKNLPPPWILYLQLCSVWLGGGRYSVVIVIPCDRR